MRTASARGLVAAALALFSLAEVRAADPRPSPARPSAPSWSDLLTRDEVGASAWTRAHPTWDGRGVVVAVLDTGVDPSLAGLTALPPGVDQAGGPKVIETRDFSGEGRVELRTPLAAVEGGVAVLRLAPGGDGDPGGVVRGFDAAEAKPRGALGLGFFSEGALAGSAVSDIDRDGRSDGRFAVLAFERQDGVPVAIVDTDGDGDLADEEVRRSYADDPRWFVFQPRARDPRDARAPVAITVHVEPGARRVELHFDDGGHGSHCAGIAAGWRVDGKDGFDGIAPGARVMSLKIGANTLAGGATTAGSMTEAIRFASEWARQHQQPVVINLSYGIGNERDGMGAIDKLLDDELAANPWLAVAVSAGNDGPGLSNVGMPGSATLAWTSAAMLPEGQARTIYGGAIKGRKVFSFSSRGGELWKPDGLAPGVAWSTVPAFEDSSVKAGTSMASPQAAGVHALLASAALAQKLPWTNGLAHRALATGAKPLAGYSPLDQGAGLIDVGAAWEAYQREAKDASAGLVAGWKVTTPLPTHPGRSGSASYWRTGRYLPEPTEAVTFDIAPILYTSAAASARGDHLDKLELTPDVGWLTVDRSTLVLRGTQPGHVVVRLDAAAVGAKPGVHVGRVRARTRGNVAFDLPVVVVVPEGFGDGAWGRSFEGTVQPGDVARVFVEVPPGATAMAAHLAARGKYGNAWLLPYDPDGHAVEEFEHHASTEDQTTGDFLMAGAALRPGVWELVVYGSYKNRGPTSYALDVAFRALDAPDALVYKVGDGGVVTADLALANRIEQPFRGAVEVVAVGVRRTKTVDVKGSKLTVPVTVGDDFASADVGIELDEATWDRMTDVAVNVLDASGRIVVATGMSARRARLSIDGGPGRYTLEITGALADPSDAASWSFALTEDLRRREPRPFAVEPPAGMSSGRVTLYPQVPTTLGLSLTPALPEAPDGFEQRAALTLTALDGAVWTKLELPLRRAPPK
ncbi:MAG: S8 family serine peptidase [Myxococcota bacterium]